MSNDLQVFAPEGKEITLRGENIKILPLKVRQFPVMLKAFSAFGDKAKSGVEQADWLDLFSQHTDKLVEALAAATGKPPEWINDLYLDESIQLAEAVWEVNQDFFVNRVLPMLVKALGGAQRLPASVLPVTH